MLSRLSISNYALIEQLDFEPGEGFSIITGETGAGKSVMLGALLLLKGERADMKVISDKTKKAVVEASFSDIDGSTAAKVLAFDPEWDGHELILRREILPSGRSRAFINDSPATIHNLEEVADDLLDIHSQNSNTILSQQSTQLRLVDSIAGNENLLSQYSRDYKKYVALRQQIKTNREEVARNKEQAEIIAFRLGILDKLKPKAGELKKIEIKHETLSNAEEIRESLLKARKALYGGETSGEGAVDLIDNARSALSDIDFTLWEEEDPEIQERLRRCVVELKDIVETIEGVVGLMEFEPEALASLSSRMKDYYTAFKTFRVETDERLEEMHAELKRQFACIENEDSDTLELEREAREIAKILKQQAAELTERRRKGASDLTAEIETEARKLGLENLRFEIELSNCKLSKTGGDRIQFKAAFNKNGALLPVGEIASGGEMARLMLAIKKITSARLSLPTIVFDEIDTGVSGPIASRMGDMMMEMGRVIQILTITHLPQVAVKGTRHFKVYKTDRQDKTVSDVMMLTDVEREEEIARMLSGEKINEAALINARSLLKK